MDIRLRAADHNDKHAIFSWRNDPWIIQHGLSQFTVSWSEHCLWFEKIMGSEDYLLFVIETISGEGIGCVRFNRLNGTTAEIHIYLLQRFTGKGLGPKAIAQGCGRAFQSWPDVQRILARVRRENAPSRNAFLKAGFQESEQATDHQGPALTLERADGALVT
jgi:RimJ/RimL family protein N-acetyltransferase